MWNAITNLCTTGFPNKYKKNAIEMNEEIELKKNNIWIFAECLLSSQLSSLDVYSKLSRKCYVLWVIKVKLYKCCFWAVHTPAFSICCNRLICHGTLCHSSPQTVWMMFIVKISPHLNVSFRIPFIFAAE